MKFHNMIFHHEKVVEYVQALNSDLNVFSSAIWNVFSVFEIIDLLGSLRLDL